MKIIEGAEAREIRLELKGRHYEFPCGCRFEADPDLPMVNDHHPIVLDRDMPLDCPLVWEMLAAGATTGVFQLESRLGKTYAQKLKPTSLDHLAALVAILRPGCLNLRDELGVSMTDKYCLRKNGLMETTYTIPAVEPYLKNTYGVLTYQETLLSIAKGLAGFDLVMLDRLRKGVGKKDLDILMKLQQEFVDGAEKVGTITRDEATSLFEDMKKSGRYLFNKCIDGNEFIRRSGSGRFPAQNIGEMHRIRNDEEYARRTGRIQLHEKWRRRGHYGSGLSIDHDGRIRKNIIEDIQPSGVRLLYEVELLDGKKTRVTGNHKFPTNLGESTVDAMLVRFHSRRTWDGLELATCGSCDETPSRERRTRRGREGRPVVMVGIASITPVGEGMTYDVTMRAPNHTFTTGEGIVTCNSHAVTYGYGTYESAYVKAHFPAYFFTSYLDGARHKMKPLKEVKHLIRDARRFGFEVVTPRFVDLEPDFSTDDVKIRFGLTNLKGVGSKAVDKIRSGLERGPLLTWSWFDFLRHGATICGASAVRAFVMGGVMDEYGVARRRMLAEFEAWNELTGREREWLCGLGDAVHKSEDVFEKIDVETTEPVCDKTAMKAYKSALERGGPPPDHPEPTGLKTRTRKVKTKVGETAVLVDPARPCSNLEEGLEGILARPGAVSKGRRDKVESILMLLRNPPYSLTDTPHLIAKSEEELYGVPVTTLPIDRADGSICDTTIREFLDGKDPWGPMTIKVEVQEVFEKAVRNGDNRGALMASLLVSDGRDFLDDVVVFPESWERNRLKLMRPGALVAVSGKRSNRNPAGFIVEDVWEI